jgi:hypothetical protein
VPARSQARVLNRRRAGRLTSVGPNPRSESSHSPHTGLPMDPSMPPTKDRHSQQVLVVAKCQ